MPASLTEKEILNLEREKANYLKHKEKYDIIVSQNRAKLGQLSGSRLESMLSKIEKAEVNSNKYRSYAKARSERLNGEINDNEWSRIVRSEKKHRMYDRISAVVKRFMPKNKLMAEGMTFEKEGKTFENKGRMFLGGTKAMSKFVEPNGKVWLCKEAVTCVSTYKPMGALVTEAASKLQERLNPDSAIKAFVYRDQNDRILGSLQEKVDVDPDAIDLFKWQTNTINPLTPDTKNQIMREHVTDWLLCNYDTKGENFITDKNGVIRGIDKEQSFSYLGKEETKHMSMTYSPNPNVPLYNTLFNLYVEGKTDLDLQSVVPFIQKMEDMPAKEYVDLFKDMIDVKCKGNPEAIQKMGKDILERKENLREEYRTFFGEISLKKGDQSCLDKDNKFIFNDELNKHKEIYRKDKVANIFDGGIVKNKEVIKTKSDIVKKAINNDKAEIKSQDVAASKEPLKINDLTK